MSDEWIQRLLERRDSERDVNPGRVRRQLFLDERPGDGSIN